LPRKRRLILVEWSEIEDGVMEKEVEVDLPNRIFAHLTREAGRNVYNVFEVTSGSFEKETFEARDVVENAADLETDSYFQSVYRKKKEYVLHTKTNWICYEFKERRIGRLTTQSAQVMVVRAGII
jgi:cytoplasmic iron level regulating protein YaaA (DUF328/UPF0246 family)